MKSILISILSAIFLTVLLSGCKEESIQIINNPPIPDFKGQLTGNTNCKGFQISPSSIDSSDSSSCIEYSYNALRHTLTLQHINANFNCCPDSLNCLFSLLNDTIIVDEHEKFPGCNCNCLFDLFMEINGIESKEYHIKIIEPYCGDQEKLYFNIDLTSVNQGSYCVKRTNYPWGALISDF